MGGREIDIRNRAYEFAVSIVRFVQQLPRSPETRVLGNQLLRAGTSVGANLEEADGALTKADFRYKVSVAQKEAKETIYWIRLLVDTELAQESKAQGLLSEAEELAKILSKIVRVTKASK